MVVGWLNTTLFIIIVCIELSNHMNSESNDNAASKTDDSLLDVLEAIQFYWECRLVCAVPSVYTTKQLNSLYKLIYQQTEVLANYAYSAVTTYLKHCANKPLPKHLTCHVATSNDLVVLSPVKFVDTESNDHLYNTKHIPKTIKSLKRICLNNEATTAVKQATTAWKQFTLNQIYADSQQW